MFAHSHHARHVLYVFVFALSIVILGSILLWTLNHTDIVAFVTALLTATALEAVLISLLLKASPIPENSISNQRGGGGIWPTLISTKMANLPELLRKE